MRRPTLGPVALEALKSGRLDAVDRREVLQMLAEQRDMLSDGRAPLGLLPRDAECGEHLRQPFLQPHGVRPIAFAEEPVHALVENHAPHLVGQARARGLALLAEPLSAEKAEQWGLIWKAVDDDALMSEAEKLCAHFATAPTVGLGLIKRALDASEDNDLKTQLDLEKNFQRQAGSHEDYKEGVKAFLAKRKPNYTGRR